MSNCVCMNIIYTFFCGYSYRLNPKLVMKKQSAHPLYIIIFFLWQHSKVTNTLIQNYYIEGDDVLHGIYIYYDDTPLAVYYSTDR